MRNFGENSLGSDGTIKLWSQLQNECLTTLTGHSGWVNLIQLDGEGKLISGSYDRTVKLWDLNKGSKLHTLRGHKGNARGRYWVLK